MLANPNKRVLVEVTDVRAISSDSTQWMLLKRNKKTDKETKQLTGGYSEWVSYKYFRDFGGAAKCLEEELIRGCGARTFTELSRLTKQIHDALKETFTLAESYKK